MNITVYCGASIGTKEIYKLETAKLGNWIADRGDTLVYGGGNIGLMGTIADSVLHNGGKAIGIMPTFLMERELAHTNLTEMIIVESMTERKLKMIELGDCYIALPGGPGTLEEISEVISWARLGKNNNPCIFLNIDGHYNSLKNYYDDMVKNGFLSESDRSKVLFADSFDEIDKFIKAYEPPVVRQYKK
ncbi:MAG: TIGR00730 family Rossman fold protein [Candidatus Delongbacteria bacterium]|nr:MAG: TIGR00730 family Rossman fold protein [Candidatus Delongbacteria bacterium]